MLDYGCGTGTLGRFLLPHVRSVTGADNSAGMLDVLGRKIAEEGLMGMSTLHLDLQRAPGPAARFDLIASAMALHHIENTAAVLAGLFATLRPGGTVCLADLDTEPGTFHGDPAAASVFHHGFDRDALLAMLAKTGFVDGRAVTACAFPKPDADGTMREYSVFLAVAHKPADDDKEPEQ